MTTRQGKTQTGSHEYHLAGNYYATRMCDNRWYIFEGKQGAGARDVGIDFLTLRACRQWAKPIAEAAQ